MDELDSQGALVMIDHEIAKAENETRQRIVRVPDDKEYERQEWHRFNLEVAALRHEREVLVMTMARVKSFEVPKIVIVSNPHGRG